MLIKNHENCFNTQSIKTDAALSFAKLYRSRDFFPLYNLMSIYFNENSVRDDLPFYQFHCWVSSTSFTLLIAHIEPKILWLEIHPGEYRSKASSYPLKSRHREAGKSFQRNDQIRFPVVPTGKRQQSLFRLQGVDQGCISGSADGRISSKKADASPGRGKAAFFEWNERREFLFVYSLLSFDSLCRRFPFSLSARIFLVPLLVSSSVPIGNLHGQHSGN